MALTIRIVPPTALGSLEDEPELVASFDGPRVVIGRGAGCDLVLPDPTVSARHASVRQRTAGYVIVDEGSTNGILVGSARLAAHTPGPLRDRGLVRIGRVWLEVHTAVGCVDPTRKPDALARSWVRRQLHAAGEPVCPVLRVTAGPDAGASFRLEDPGRERVVGRSPQSDWTLNDPDLSRRHLAVELRGADVLVWDLNSKRGSALGGKALTSEPRRWRPGEPLDVGRSTIELVDPVPEALEELRRSPDERMRAAEFGEPPPVIATAGDADDTGAASSRADRPEEDGGGAAVGVVDSSSGEEPSSFDEAAEAGATAEEPAPTDEDESLDDPSPSAQGNGGRLVELGVVLVALVVIALSAVGLLLLLRR